MHEGLSNAHRLTLAVVIDRRHDFEQFTRGTQCHTVRVQQLKGAMLMDQVKYRAPRFSHQQLRPVRIAFEQTPTYAAGGTLQMLEHPQRDTRQIGMLRRIDDKRLVGPGRTNLHDTDPGGLGQA
ncbi:hypothetical protein D3C77_479490 [compost metagenome]